MNSSIGKRFIIGDIHGDYRKLNLLLNRVSEDFHPKRDMFIFLGDYVSHGPDSYKVIDFLVTLSSQVKTVFLLGDHDHLFLEFLSNPVGMKDYIKHKGGNATLESYTRELGDARAPESHMDFLTNLQLTYEESDFFCVHAGLNPSRSNVREQKVEDLLSIGEAFYGSERVWKKMIIFGHTPSSKLHSRDYAPYFNNAKNLMGLDTGSGLGGRLTCYEVRTQRFYQS